MADVQLVFNFLISCFQSIGVLYTTSFILGAALALWVFGRLVNIFRRLLP